LYCNSRIFTYHPAERANPAVPASSPMKPLYTFRRALLAPLVYLAALFLLYFLRGPLL